MPEFNLATKTIMSSYSEYLNRQKQRVTQILDVRPHRDAGHQTAIIRQMAAGAVLFNTAPATVCAGSLNAPSTTPANGTVYYKGKAQYVKDASAYAAYKSGQAVATIEGVDALNKVKKYGAQLTREVCMTNTTLPEYNDKLRADPNLALIQAQKNAYQRGYATANCPTCGGIYGYTKIQFAAPCNCAIKTSELAAPNANGVMVGIKSARQFPHTLEPNA